MQLGWREAATRAALRRARGSTSRSHPYLSLRPPLHTNTAQAKRYSHGVRLAKTHELDSDLMNLALKSTPAVMIDTADYLFAKVRNVLIC